MFIARLTDEPDTCIFGRAIGMRYKARRDDAMPEHIKKRDWVKCWPHYVGIHHAEFIAGTLANGVSLNELMDELKADSFASTQENTARGEGNTAPRHAYLLQPQIRLSTDGLAWLNKQLQAAFDAHGVISHRELDKLDWPDALVDSLSPNDFEPTQKFTQQQFPAESSPVTSTAGSLEEVSPTAYLWRVPQCGYYGRTRVERPIRLSILPRSVNHLPSRSSTLSSVAYRK